MRIAFLILFFSFLLGNLEMIFAQQGAAAAKKPPAAPGPVVNPGVGTAAPAVSVEALQQIPLIGVGATSDEVASAAAARGLAPRDPFRLPEELVIKLRQRMATTNAGGYDPTIEAVRRFPLTSYQLVGIIWDVKKPKAMFMDRLNSIHMLQVNDFIGNAKGVITAIQSGSVTILEGKIPQIIKLKK